MLERDATLVKSKYLFLCTMVLIVSNIRSWAYQNVILHTKATTTAGRIPGRIADQVSSDTKVCSTQSSEILGRNHILLRCVCGSNKYYVHYHMPTARKHGNLLCNCIAVPGNACSNIDASHPIFSGHYVLPQSHGAKNAYRIIVCTCKYENVSLLEEGFLSIQK